MKWTIERLERLAKLASLAETSVTFPHNEFSEIVEEMLWLKSRVEWLDAGKHTKNVILFEPKEARRVWALKM